MDVDNIERTSFGPGFEGHPENVFRDELKGMNPLERVRAFKARIDDYLISQTERLASTGPWMPFPLTVMTLVGIELLGSYKYGDPGNNRNRHFQRIVEDIDPTFGEKKPNPDGKTVPISDFIYSAFRNTYIHGFLGKWVFITHRTEEAEKWIYGRNDRLVVVNIYWFWTQFKRVYTDFFESLLKANDPACEPLLTFGRTFKRHFSEWL